MRFPIGIHSSSIHSASKLVFLPSNFAIVTLLAQEKYSSSFASLLFGAYCFSRQANSHRGYRRSLTLIPHTASTPTGVSTSPPLQRQAFDLQYSYTLLDDHAFNSPSEGIRCSTRHRRLHYFIPFCTISPPLSANHPGYASFPHKAQLTCPTDQKDTSSQEFYTRTVAALDRNDASDQEAALKLQAMKDAAKAQDPVGMMKAPQKPVVGGADKKASFPAPEPSALAATEKAAADKVVDSVDSEKSVAGRKTMKGGETKDLRSGKEAPLYPKGDVANETTAEEKAETEEEHKIESELNTILKKGPSTFLRSLALSKMPM